MLNRTQPDYPRLRARKKSTLLQSSSSTSNGLTQTTSSIRSLSQRIDSSTLLAPSSSTLCSQTYFPLLITARLKRAPVSPKQQKGLPAPTQNCLVFLGLVLGSARLKRAGGVGQNSQRPGTTKEWAWAGLTSDMKEMRDQSTEWLLSSSLPTKEIEVLRVWLIGAGSVLSSNLKTVLPILMKSREQLYSGKWSTTRSLGRQPDSSVLQSIKRCLKPSTSCKGCLHTSPEQQLIKISLPSRIYLASVLFGCSSCIYLAGLPLAAWTATRPVRVAQATTGSPRTCSSRTRCVSEGTLISQKGQRLKEKVYSVVRSQCSKQLSISCSHRYMRNTCRREV